MSVCKNCGVELEEHVENCPLCGESISEGFQKKKEPPDRYEPVHEQRLLSDFKELTPTQRQKLFWQLSGIVLISGMIVTFIIDLIINREITWSKYTMSTSMILFINITLLVFLKNKTAWALTGCFIATSLLLILFDLFNKNIGWGSKLGVPLVFSFYLVVYILVSIVRKSKQRGINLIAYFILAAGILSLCVEGIISVQVQNQLSFQWSIIAMASVIPVASVLLFIHYRLRKGTELKRFFHI
jgi:hypothetical protein